MASFVQDVIAVTFGEVATVWESAGHPVVRPVFDGADGETCNAGTLMA